MARMSVLNLTTEQLEREFVRLYADGKWVPDKLWMESFHGEASFLRAVYSREFSAGAADRLMELRRQLMELYGMEADVVICVHFEDAGWDYFAAHRLNIHLAR